MVAPSLVDLVDLVDLCGRVRAFLLGTTIWGNGALGLTGAAVGWSIFPPLHPVEEADNEALEEEER